MAGIDGMAGRAGIDAGAAGALGDAGAFSLASAIEDFCDQLAALPCGKSKQQCVDDATALIDEAALKGCSGEYRALLECAANGTAECGANGVSLPDCAAEMAALDACDPPSGNCFGADVPGVSCSMSCATWSAACSETPGGLECSCTAGPHAGKVFTLAGSCAPSWSTQAQTECQ